MINDLISRSNYTDYVAVKVFAHMHRHRWLENHIFAEAELHIGRQSMEYVLLSRHTIDFEHPE